MKRKSELSFPKCNEQIVPIIIVIINCYRNINMIL